MKLKDCVSLERNEKGCWQANLNLLTIFEKLIENLDEEQMEDLLSSLSLNSIMEKIMLKRLSDPYELGCYGGCDYRFRLEILSKMEDVLISELSWTIMYDMGLNSLIKNAQNDEELYFKMYHDDEHKDFFRQWLSENKIKSAADCVSANAKLEKIEKYIDNIFEKITKIKAKKND